MTQLPRFSVLMVCLGNICRSPTAEATFRRVVEEAGLADRIFIDSAGTSNWHEGDQPDSRSMAHAARRNYDLGVQHSRPIVDEDFARFDYIFAMDNQNLRDLKRRCPATYQHKLSLFLGDGVNGYREVPDPYEGGASGFELVLDLCEEASAILLQRLLNQQGAGREHG